VRRIIFKIGFNVVLVIFLPKNRQNIFTDAKVRLQNQNQTPLFLLENSVSLVEEPFSVLALLVEQQTGHPACKSSAPTIPKSEFLGNLAEPCVTVDKLSVKRNSSSSSNSSSISSRLIVEDSRRRL